MQALALTLKLVGLVLKFLGMLLDECGLTFLFANQKCVACAPMRMHHVGCAYPWLHR
jgi:hypothetical protein